MGHVITGTCRLVCARMAPKHNSGLADDLSYHDLTHYAIENTLGCRHAFFGLIAQVWDMVYRLWV